MTVKQLRALLERLTDHSKVYIASSEPYSIEVDEVTDACIEEVYGEDYSALILRQALES